MPASDPFARLADLEGVGSAMAAARDGIDAALRDQGLRARRAELTAESLLCGAHASARLDGSTASLEDLRAGAGDEIAASSARVSAGLLVLVVVLTRTPMQALARLHTLAGKGVTPDSQLGRPRDAASADRLGSLARSLVSPTSASALVVAAVVHAELATAAPFASRNGVVARAAERLVLAGRGVDPTSLLVPEAGHLRLRSAYEAALAGYRDHQVRGWLLYAADAYAAAAEASPVAGRPHR